MALYRNDNGNLSLIAGSTLYADAPIGAIQAFGGSVAPGGWLLCQGQAISRTTYADLFAVIGTNFGVGDGSTTFNLPDLEGKVAAGYKSNETEFNEIGKTGGEKAHTLTVTEMPTHTHPNTSLNVSSTQFIQGGNIGNWVANTANSGSAGGGGAHNNLQPYVVTNYIIKAQMVSAPADFMEAVDEVKSDLSIKRAEVSATQATITTKIQQFYQALSVATDLQLRHAVIIRYGSNYNYVYRIESKQNDVYQFCSQQQNSDTNIILRTLNIKPSGSTAWLFTVSGASANTLTEQTTANDTSVWELYY